MRNILYKLSYTFYPREIKIIPEEKIYKLFLHLSDI